MPDKEFLNWLHDRLAQVHGENRDVDHMRKLRSIIAETPADRITTNAAA